MQGQGEDELLPLATYGPLIWIVAIICLVAAIAWMVLWYRGMKKKPTQKEKPAQTATHSVANIRKLKKKYLKQIDKAHSEYQAQQIKYADLYQELSRLIRQFVHEITGINMNVMTLEQLEQQENKEIAIVIQTLYPSEFSGVENIDDADQATKRAVKVVSEWR